VSRGAVAWVSPGSYECPCDSAAAWVDFIRKIRATWSAWAAQNVGGEHDGHRGLEFLRASGRASARYIPYLAATMFAWTALVVASDAAPMVRTPS
jgi:hypothetical protein